ncbi:MAG: BlaI/MecI/CopY family transcriptional regulator [bacterium]
MSRRRSKILSERELEVMRAVWKLGLASVREIRLEMGGENAGAYTSIATMLKFLEKKGMLRHEQFGRTYYYSANTSQSEEQQKALNYILQGYFEGNWRTLLKILPRLSRMNAEDRSMFQKLLAEMKQGESYSEGEMRR